MNTRFGSRYVLGGSHEDIPQARVQYNKEAKRLCSARFTKKIIGGKACNLVRSLPNFKEAEELVLKKCAFQTQELNRKEQEELQMLKYGLPYDP